MNVNHRQTVSFSNDSNLRYWGTTIQILCSLSDLLVQMSTTHSSFDQYCISHKIRAAAAPGPEGRLKCPMT